MLSLQEVGREIKEHEDKVSRLRKTRRQILSISRKSPERMLLHCGGCKRRSKLSRWTLIVENYYVPPSGCTEGAYWTNSRSSSAVRCPRCGYENRLYDGLGVFSEAECERLFLCSWREQFRQVEERFDGKTHKEAFGRD